MKKINWCDVAMFVAGALTHVDGFGRSYSHTIQVHQHKSKFDQVVVYCDIADAALVALEYEKRADPAETYEHFYNRCIQRDAVRFRRAYLSMLKLLPEGSEEPLFARANYRYLLLKNVDELNDWLDNSSDFRTNVPYRQMVLDKWNVDDKEALREVLTKVYVSTSHLVAE